VKDKSLKIGKIVELTEEVEVESEMVTILPGTHGLRTIFLDGVSERTNKMKRTLKDKYEDEMKDLIRKADEIEKATSYKHGDGLEFSGTYHCSNSQNNDCMSWVRQAEKQFIDDNKKNILKLAAKMCREYAGEE
jgi:predicted porin